MYAANVELTASRGAALLGNAATWGGALYVQRALDWLVLEAGSRLAGSRAGDSGGAVYIVGDGAAASNNASAGATATAGSGPAAGPSSVVVRGSSVVEDNVAAAAGGECSGAWGPAPAGHSGMPKACPHVFLCARAK